MVGACPWHIPGLVIIILTKFTGRAEEAERPNTSINCHPAYTVSKG